MKQVLPVTKRYQQLLLLLIIIGTAVLYVPALQNKFNNWDDEPYITRNPRIALSRENIQRSFTEGETHRMYAPLTALSHSVTHRYFDLDPQPYIALNIVLHLVNVLLVFFFISLISEDKSIAFLTTLLFAIHPMQVESVAYAAGRRDVLYVLFYLLCMICYIRHTQGGRRSLLYYLLSCSCAIAAMLSKGQAITIPFTLLLIDLVAGRSLRDHRTWLNKIPFFLFFLIVAYLVFKAPSFASGGFSSTSYLTTDIPFFTSVIYACYGAVEYIILLFVPYSLALVHPYPLVNGAYVVPAFYYLCPMLLAALIYLLFTLWRNNRQVWFGMLFFAINIGMLLQFIPNSYGIMNDHYVYFACIGIFYATAAVLCSLRVTPVIKKAGVAIGICYLACLFYLSEKRIAVFRDSMHLWTDVIGKYPDDFLAYYNRGIIYQQEHKQDRAIQDYTQAIRCEPGFLPAYLNRFELFEQQQQYKEALQDLDAITRIDSLYPGLFYNRAIMKSKMDDAAGALQDMNMAIKLDPGNAELYDFRGRRKYELDDLIGALADYTTAISMDHSNPQYYYLRALTRRITNDDKGCIADLDSCILLDAGFTDAYTDRAYSLLLNGRYRDALQDCAHVLAKETNNAKAEKIKELALKGLHR